VRDPISKSYVDVFSVIADGQNKPPVDFYCARGYGHCLGANYTCSLSLRKKLSVF